jgi:hypothetical protein
VILVEFKNIILEEQLSNKFKKGNENFSGFVPFLNLLDNCSSKMMFLKHQESQYSRHFFFIFETKTEVLKRFQKQLCKITCGPFPMPLKKGIFSVFGRFIDDYLRNLTCWEKSEIRFGLCAPN